MKKSDTRSATIESRVNVSGQPTTRLRELVAELQQLETKLRQGGGLDKIDRQHKQGKLTARERIDLLLDKDSYSQEIGLLVAYDQYDGGAPGAGVVTVVGRIANREVRGSRFVQGRRLFTCVIRHHHYGRGHFIHGAWRRESCEGGDRTDDR